MKHQGWSLDHQRGSHQIWYSPKAFRLSVQNRNGKAEGYQAGISLNALVAQKLHQSVITQQDDAVAI